MTRYDILVVGGGLAALTAGLFAARAGRSTLVLSRRSRRALVNVSKIEDYPGFPEGVAGFEIGPNAQLQAMNNGAEFAMAEVLSLARPGDEMDGGEHGDWLVTTTDGSIRPAP